MSSSTLFKVVPIKLYGNDNTTISTFAFLDGEKGLFDKLRLDGTQKELVLQYTKGQTRSEQSYETTILLSSVKNRKLHKLRNVHTVANLELPRYRTTRETSAFTPHSDHGHDERQT